jgi:uncharacterized protein
VRNDSLVVDAKGIYSIEKFIVARRLMYWQVYLHKTVLGAEQLLVNVLLRAKELAQNGVELFGTPALRYFLYNDITKENFSKDPETLQQFALLDDYDMFASIKVWAFHSDKVLSILCNALVNRRLFKVELDSEPTDENKIMHLLKAAEKQFDIPSPEVDYLVSYGSTSNNAYDPVENLIMIQYKDGSLKDVAKASDQLNIEFLSKPVTKYFLVYPKELK